MGKKRNLDKPYHTPSHVRVICTKAEECDCVCNDEGLCCCHGEKDARTSSSSDTPEAPLRMTPDFEEFDGVDDILAVR
ncbi:uncharacterized protein TNCT_313491 [Trichonephila clavata]|uniref:Uncharacterized protein n=1 Tax=Trichonephila clavata TaxID=2740835 RepID=A0A8X6LKS1_TRICU|nr:uncharacterized protein TNCT_313491 [Trichonephila clavata]